MVLVSVTRLRLQSPLYVPAFLWHTGWSTWQIINTPGFLGGKLLGNADRVSWTLTTWEDKSAMQNYRNSGAHRQTMPHIQKWCDEAAVVHWEQQDSSLPDAVEAHRRMVENGNFIRLSKPSSAQSSRKISQPQSSDSRGLLLKPRRKNVA